MADDLTRRSKNVAVLADLPGADRQELTALAVGIDPRTRDSGPGDLLVGTTRPQGALAVEAPAAPRPLVETGVVVDPGTVGRFEGQRTPIAASGLSSWVTQLPQRVDGAPASGPGSTPRAQAIFGPRGQVLARLAEPVDAAPWSHLLRVVDGHLCIVLNDPLEHSAADRADLPGGGFLATVIGRHRIRTRLGDALGPMVLGKSSTPALVPVDQGGQEEDGRTTISREDAESADRALAGTTARHHSQDGSSRPYTQGGQS